MAELGHKLPVGKPPESGRIKPLALSVVLQGLADRLVLYAGLQNNKI